MFVLCHFSSGVVRLVRPAEGATLPGPPVLPPANVIHAIRDAEQRPDVRERPHGGRTQPSCRTPATTAAGEPNRRRSRWRSWRSGRGFETDPTEHVRQRVHALHVQLALRLRRHRLPENRAPVRPDLLGHQPGLRGRLPAVAVARLPAPHAAAHQLGYRHPPIHPDAHHRRAPPLTGPAQPTRFHRRPPQSSGEQLDRQRG